MYVVRLLDTLSMEVPWMWYANWSNCVKFISSITFQVFSIFREGNRVVDALSKRDVVNLGMSCNFHLPNYCNSLYGYDVLAFRSFRFC